MKFDVDQAYLIEALKEIIATPSPVGYYVQLNPVLEKMAAELGLEVTYDNRCNAYITLEGEDNSKTVMVGAHADTLGLIIRGIDKDGVIRVRELGGLNYHSAEGETVTVHTRDGREYTGLLACQSHSVHVFTDARSMERDEVHMMVLLDENVHSKAEVNALGIRNGDHVSIEPHFELTENGYVKTRFIDDKGAMGCVFAMLKYLKDNNLKPKYRTMLAFPYAEEIGQGGTYVPEGVSEYIAMDIGLIGPDYDGNEYKVSISTKDNGTVYNYELVNRLIAYAEKAECDYAVDTFNRYSTDGAAAMRAGHNLKAAAFGMAVYCSHGRERTHLSGLVNTTGLLLAYVLDI